jgi:hypothetical protein
VDIHFTVGTSCERAAPFAEKNAAARHHVLRSLISLHNEHPIDNRVLMEQQAYEKHILSKSTKSQERYTAHNL